MKLNLYIVKEELEEMVQGFSLREPCFEVNLSYALLCDRLPEKPLEDVLYLLQVEDLSVPAYSLVHFICVGTPKTKLPGQFCEYLAVEPDVSLSQLMNRVTMIFHRYQKWEDDLRQALDQGLPLVELAERSSSIIKNPIWFQASGYRLVFQYKPILKEESELYRYYKSLPQIPNNTIIKAEEINSLLSDPEYLSSAHALVPTIYNGGTYGFRSLFYNIRIHDAPVARILFDEVIQPITQKDYALIKILGDYIARGMTAENIYTFERPRNLDAILGQLLDGHSVAADQTEEILDYYRWSPDDTYFCMSCQLVEAAQDSSALEPLAISLNLELSGCCYTIREKRILFIINLTQEKRSKHELFEKLVPILRDNLLKATTSSTYTDFHKLFYYYQQILIIEKLGMKKDPTVWYYHAENYQLDYILQKCCENSLPELLIPEGLYRLRAHDEANGTDFVKLLSIYLKHERNIADSIREAYMHRNTFLYRINRLKEILNMNLDDPDVRICLQIALKILQGDEK